MTSHNVDYVNWTDETTSPELNGCHIYILIFLFDYFYILSELVVVNGTMYESLQDLAYCQTTTTETMQEKVMKTSLCQLLYISGSS